MNNPFDYTPDKACDDAFRKLIAELEGLKRSDSHADSDFIKEIDSLAATKEKEIMEV